MLKPIDILLIVALTILVVGVSAYLIIKKKKGQTGCGCGCNGCPSAASCMAAKRGQESQNNEEGATHV